MHELAGNPVPLSPEQKWNEEEKVIKFYLLFEFLVFECMSVLRTLKYHFALKLTQLGVYVPFVRLEKDKYL